MRGGVLSRLLSAFRLRQAVLSGAPDVAEGTAKHGLNDHHDIGRAKHVGLLRSAVDQLFSTEYLTERGLDRCAAIEHNDLVAQALDAMLTQWDQQAVIANAATSNLPRFDEMLGLATGFSIELMVRLVAYEARYGYLHGFLDDIALWIREPKLKAWWADIERRASQPIRSHQLYSKGELEAHTVRELREGRSLPKEMTIPVLAGRLAARSIRDRREPRSATRAELELELRFAVAVVEHGDTIKRFLAPKGDDVVPWAFQVLRRLVGEKPDAMSQDLLLHGTNAAPWRHIREDFDAAMCLRAWSIAEGWHRDLDRRKAEIRERPKEAVRQIVEECNQQVAYLRTLDVRPGADGPEQRLAEDFENYRDLLSLLIDGPQPNVRAELATEMQADALCMEAVAPWLPLSMAEKEERLREAVRTCDWLPYARRCLADHLSQTGRVDEAVQHLRRAVELNPVNEDGRESLALIYLEQRKYQEALALTDQYQFSVTLRAVRAKAVLALGNTHDAEELARSVLADHPTHTLALRALADCLRARGEEGKARELDMKADLYLRGVRPPGTR